jgi:hypothetical protein
MRDTWEDGDIYRRRRRLPEDALVKLEALVDLGDDAPVRHPFEVLGLSTGVPGACGIRSQWSGFAACVETCSIRPASEGVPGDQRKVPLSVR